MNLNSDTPSNYIYLGSSPESIFHNEHVKLGGSTDVIDRKSTYNTSFSMHPFQYERIYKIYLPFRQIEQILTIKVKNTRSTGGEAGIEYYNRSDINHKYIIDTFTKYNIPYTIEQEDELERINRKIKKKFLSTKITTMFNPRTHQKEAYNRSLTYFLLNNIGMIIWACGLGKTLEALYIAIRGLDKKDILIGVSSIALINQWKEVIEQWYPEWADKIIINGGGHTITQNNLEQKGKIVLTTYHSLKKIYTIQTNTKKIYFDFKIGDECHHLVGKDDASNIRRFTTFHKIISNKTLYLTATPKKYLDECIHEENKIYSMDDTICFGDVIDDRTVYWAIENDYLCNYKLIDIVNTQDEINQIMEELNIINKLEQSKHKEYIDKLKEKSKKIKKPLWRDKLDELFMASYIAVKEMYEIEYLNKLILYTNKIEHADICKYYIHLILQSDWFPGINKDMFCKDIHSDKKSTEKQSLINEFRNVSEGIMTCVNILGEGHDDPSLDGVIFAEPIQSKINIIQKATRPLRLNPNKPDKIAYIIIPRINFDACEQEKIKDSFKKIESICGHLRNVDEHIFSRLLSIIDNPNRKIRKRAKYLSKDVINSRIGDTMIRRITTRVRLASKLKLTLPIFIKILQDNNINDRESYVEFQEHYTEDILPKEPNKISEEFCWRMVDKDKDNFYTKDKCIERIKQLKQDYKQTIRKYKSPHKKNKFLSTKDNRIPNRLSLWHYYGGDRSEFILFN